jgi:hypothetical protein
MENVHIIGDKALFDLLLLEVTVFDGIVAGVILLEGSFLTLSASAHVTVKASKFGSEIKIPIQMQQQQMVGFDLKIVNYNLNWR